MFSEVYIESFRESLDNLGCRFAFQVNIAAASRGQQQTEEAIYTVGNNFKFQ
jgi:hypothetical protein